MDILLSAYIPINITAKYPHLLLWRYWLFGNLLPAHRFRLAFASGSGLPPHRFVRAQVAHATSTRFPLGFCADCGRHWGKEGCCYALGEFECLPSRGGPLGRENVLF